MKKLIFELHHHSPIKLFGMSYYAVAKGRNPGVYRSWDKCKEQTHKFPGAVFKKFGLKTEAENFVETGGNQSSSFDKKGKGSSRKIVSRKIRSSNFTEPEKWTLFNIIKRYYHIIECKETDKGARLGKNEVWKRIRAEFTTHHPDRSIENLQHCWGNLKKKVREYNARDRRETMATGGGVKNVERNALYDEIGILMAREINPLENCFDSDAPQPQLVGDLLEDSFDCGDNQDVFDLLQHEKGITDWSKWDPKKLTKPISAPLQDVMNKVTPSSSKSHPPIPSGNKLFKSVLSNKTSGTPSGAPSRNGLDSSGPSGNRADNRVFAKRLPTSGSFATRPVYIPISLCGNLSEDQRNGDGSDVKSSAASADHEVPENINPNVQGSDSGESDFTVDKNNNNSSMDYEAVKYGDYEKEKRDLDIKQMRMNVKRSQMQMESLMDEKKMKLEELKMKKKESRMRIKELKMKKRMMHANLELKTAQLNALMKGSSSGRISSGSSSDSSSED